MSLPEPSFIERDAITITQELIQHYELMTGKTLQPAQVERLLIDLIAYREMLLRIGIQEAAKQNLVEYAAFPMLDYLGELVGVTRLEAQSATAIMRFTLTEAQTFDVLIPEGTQIETKDGKFIFATKEGATINAGQTNIEVTAAEGIGGAEANGYIAGEINGIVNPIAYVAGAVNVSVSMGGSEQESDDRLRARIKEAPEGYSNAGSKGAYRYHAMSAHQNIVDVAVMSLSPGQINLYPLTCTGTPTDAILDMVEAAVNADKVRPLTDGVNVLAPTRVDFSIVANVTLFVTANADNVAQEIQGKLDSYVGTMKSSLGRDIIKSQIIAHINGVSGVYKTELVSPAEDRILDDNEWASCSNVAVTVVGAANG